MRDLFGIPVFVSPALPVIPSDRENIRRQVRHGLADVLEWLGEEVGPLPGEETHMLASMDFGAKGGDMVLMVSASMATNLKQKFLREAS